MAAGNHLENGICALLVIAATIIIMIWIDDEYDDHMFVIIQCPWLMVQAIATRRRASPIRLDKAVSIPAARDLEFW